MNTLQPEDFEKARNKNVAKVRSPLDYLMGLLFMLIGGYTIYKYKPDVAMMAFGGLAILYGVWRFYKGYKKNTV